MSNTKGEFTKNIRDVLKVMDDDGKFHRKIMEEAIEIIDRAESINTDLLEACEGLMEKADNGSADFDDPVPGSIYLKANAAIAKAKQ